VIPIYEEGSVDEDLLNEGNRGCATITSGWATLM